ncbi:MAG: Tn3 family transposase [Pseudonocardia sp.]
MVCSALGAHRHPRPGAASAWCRFGNAGVIADNDPEEQEKILKFSTLLTNAVIFHTTLDMMTVIRELIAEGWTITSDDLGSP